MIFKARDRNRSKSHHIELNLRDISQLFNTMDPSPFNERDLDHDAEEFIVSWARELPLTDPVVVGCPSEQRYPKTTTPRP